MAEELLFVDCASQAYDEQNVEHNSGKAGSMSIPAILQMSRRNSAHESCAESSTSRASRSSELPQVIHGQDSPSQSSYTFI